VKLPDPSTWIMLGLMVLGIYIVFSIALAVLIR
jgi:hypothetical protein